MEYPTPTKIKKATLVPLSWVELDPNLNAPFQIAKDLTFENIEGLIKPQMLSLWSEVVSKRERDDLLRARFAILHRFDSTGHIGREEAESNDLAFKVFLCLRIVKPTRATFEPIQVRFNDRSELEVFSFSHNALPPNIPEADAVNSYGLDDMMTLKRLWRTFWQLASEGPEHVRRAVRYFNAGFDEVRDPTLQIVVWTMGIEALFAKAEQQPEKTLTDLIIRAVGANTDIYANSPIREFIGAKPFTVGSLVGDLLRLRNVLAHGQWIPSDWKTRDGRDSLAGPSTNYADVLREAAVFILRTALLKYLEDRALSPGQLTP
jgi:hypothetical protein